MLFCKVAKRETDFQLNYGAAQLHVSVWKLQPLSSALAFRPHESKEKR